MRPAVSLVAHACVASCSYYSLSSCVASSRGLFICLRFFTVNSRSYRSFLFLFRSFVSIVCDFFFAFRSGVRVDLVLFVCCSSSRAVLIACILLHHGAPALHQQQVGGWYYFLDFVVFWAIFHRCVHTRHSGYCTRSFAHRFSRRYR